LAPRRAVGRARLQAGDRDLPLELIVGIGVAGQQVGVKAGHGERAIGRDADRIGPALAQEGVGPQRAAGVARTDAQQQAGQHAIVDARRRAAEVVDERLAVAIALHRPETAETARPYAERACAVADRHVARLGQGLTLPAAGTAACHSHLLTDRIHEQCVGGEVRGSEVGIGLTTDGVQRRRALLRVKNTERIQHAFEVAGGAGIGPVESGADGVLVGCLRAGGKSGLVEV